MDNLTLDLVKRQREELINMLAKLCNLHDEQPSQLTPEDWKEARALLKKIHREKYQPPTK